MLAVGLNATLTQMGLPLLIPPLIPPSLLVAVVPSVVIIRSLFSLPRRLTTSNPAPKLTPFTAGIEKSKWEATLSIESKNGSPMPVGTPLREHSTLPPTESPSARAVAITASNFVESVSVPIWLMRVSNLTLSPIIFLATTPAATSVRVSLPEK